MVFSSLNFNGFYSPVGGTARLVTNNIACLSTPFNRFGIALGARCTAVKLNTSPASVAVYSPIPWGPESENLLQLLGCSNVEYLVAPDIEHHMGLDSWKVQFPDATVIGPSPLARKRESNPAYKAKVDVRFSSAMANTVIVGEPLPAALAKEFEAVYINAHRNKELVLYHTPTRTMITADLFVNCPAYEQYKDSGMSPTGGFSFLTNWLGVGDRFQKYMIGGLLNVAAAKPGLKAINNWPMDRAIMCHGEIIEANANEKLAKFFDL